MDSPKLQNFNSKRGQQLPQSLYPHGGLRTSHQKSTCLHAIGFMALCGDNLYTYPSEREIFNDNLLVRVHLIIEMSKPALRHGSLNSLFQVALYPPS